MTTGTPPDTPQRVLFYGVTGSGKSAAARRYASATGLPEVSADDHPWGVSLYRLVRRTARRVVRREVVCNGNQESARNAISRDSILAWHFKSFPRKRARIRRLIEDDGVPVLRFTRPRDLDRWLRSIEAT